MTFKPMLAFSKTPDFSELKFPLVASPKLDGIRCVVRDGRALSRTLKPIPNKRLRWLSEMDGLDGELILRGGTFQETTSAVMGHDVPDDITDRVEYHVFDHHNDANAPFQQRYSWASTVVAELGEVWSNLKLVPHTLIRDAEELARYEAEQLAAGHEGIMLRALHGLYKHGRSTLKEGWLLKVKRFEDAEAEVVGFEQLMVNGNDPLVDELGRTKRSSAKAGLVPFPALGAFVLRRPDGVEFRCGSGMNDGQKAKFWVMRDRLLGAKVKYKHQPHGAKDAPRSPIFLGIRDARDM